MDLILRWYGPDDPVVPAHIRQIPYVRGVATALHGVAPGLVWTREAIVKRQERLAADGLAWTVTESIPVHEDIKIGAPGRDRAIEAWARTAENLGAAGVRTVCYNFMPVFDWMRTNLAVTASDGSTSSEYRHEDLLRIDLSKGMEALPAWAEAYSAARMAELVAAYADVDAERLWDNLAYFLERVVPVAAAAGVNLAIHPDDPPWPIFGFPRIVTGEESFARVLSLVDHPANGLTFCTGSLGATPDNDLVAMARRFAPTGRIHFGHFRNVKWTGDRSFVEVAHPRAFGSVDLVAVIRALVEGGFDGPVRPDHGRMIWGETGIPGYGLHDRALGAMYIAGAWEAAGGRVG